MDIISLLEEVILSSQGLKLLFRNANIMSAESSIKHNRELRNHDDDGHKNPTNLHI